MSLIKRRRALMTQNNDNLARFGDANWYTGVYKPVKINGGYSITARTAASGYSQFAAFDLTTFKITQRLWGKTVRVLADITSRVAGANPLFRVGFRNAGWTWSDFANKAVTTDGSYEITFTMPSACPSSMNVTYPNFMILINVQRNATSEPNTVTITNVRLEVVE